MTPLSDIAITPDELATYIAKGWVKPAKQHEVVRDDKPMTEEQADKHRKQALSRYYEKKKEAEQCTTSS